MSESRRTNDTQVYRSLAEFLDHFFPQPLDTTPMETHEDARAFGIKIARQSFKEISLDRHHTGINKQNPTH